MFVLNFFRIISILLGIVGGTFLIPIGVAVAYKEYAMILPFAIPMAISFVLMLAINIPARKVKYNLTTRQTFLTVAMSWVVASFMGAVPLYFSGSFNSFTDAAFESFSGFSTTGATILSEIESLPRSINLWRCLSHWLGGMGIVTLTVAVLPLLGVGGFQLIKAETTGPEKGKVTSRITTTAKAMWGIYMGFTVLEIIALKIAGMDFVDALSHGFATLGTGGFSTMNASIGGYNSLAIEIVITVFMFLAGINFSLFYYTLFRKSDEVKSNSELKAYLAIVFTSILLVTLCLLSKYGSFGKSLRYASFQVISLMSTTGFSTDDFLTWPATAQFIAFLMFFVGGCSGSTSGGFKVVRWVILGKQVNNETRKMLHPHGVFSIRLNGRPCNSNIVSNVASFLTVYLLLIAITTGVGCIGNLDILTSLTGALSMVGNVGPGFGLLGPSANYGFLPAFVKWWYCFAMLAGRLELYTMVIFFFPSYWKK
ncbi:MAG: TrkH family potassium uptake protein [Treponema sp.]|nr:TrkH family potassium uptake protein [Treponema sp.]